MLDKATLAKINRFIQNMPPLPVTVSKILEITKDPNVNAQQLNSVISLDPVLTGKVLKLINSAYYGLPNQVTSIVRAIVMLGINTVKNLALSTSIVTTITKQQNFNALDMEAFWRHSICVGVMAKSFAKKQGVDPKKQEEYFVAGLLHDIGKIPINSQLADNYIKAMTYARQKKMPLHQAEKDYFGLCHSQLGGQIAKQWQLNEALTSAIKYHHYIEESPESFQKFVATIALANIVTNKAEIGFSGDKFPEEKEQQIFDLIGLSWDDIDEAEDKAEDTIKKAEVFLQIS